MNKNDKKSIKRVPTMSHARCRGGGDYFPVQCYFCHSSINSSTSTSSSSTSSSSSYSSSIVHHNYEQTLGSTISCLPTDDHHGSLLVNVHFILLPHHDVVDELEPGSEDAIEIFADEGPDQGD